MEIYAHRGASGYAPENTLSAYQMAFENFHADGIEIDVHYSKDREIVVMHDFDLSSTTNGSGMIFSNSLKELKELSAGLRFSEKYNDEKIPTLKEVLQLVSEHNGKINIELKAGSFFYPDIEERIINHSGATPISNPVWGWPKARLIPASAQTPKVRTKVVKPSPSRIP